LVLSSISANIVIKLKLMKHLLLIVAFAFSAQMWAQNATSQNINISGQTDRAALWQIHQDMKLEGLNFNYNPEFNSDRTLKSISYVIMDAQGNTIDKIDSFVFGSTGTQIQIRLKKKNGKWVTESK
jgi:hypothetical protein